MAMNGIKVDRLNAIRHYLYVHGPSSSQELVAAVGSSIATLRRDLNLLEEEGVIERVHGGARLAAGSNVEVAFEEREKENLRAKRVIAEAAFQRLKPYSTIFLDAGTTVLQLARRLRIAPMPITVFTNGLAVAQELLNVPKVKMMILGGQLRPENASVIGPHAEAMLDRLWFDQLFLGTGAISTDETIYSVDLGEATLNAKMLARSAERFILVDASKFGHASTYAVGPLSSATHVIVDAAITADWRQRLANAGIEFLIAGERQERGQ
jgi:DeoR family fructose operon transcriptional repressor